MITIWGRANSVNAQKVLWCCDELVLPYERIDAGISDTGDRAVEGADQLARFRRVEVLSRHKADLRHLLGRKNAHRVRDPHAQLARANQSVAHSAFLV